MNSRPRLISAISLLTVASFCGGCSRKATPADVERLLGAKITDESGGRLKLVAFKKTADELGALSDFCWGFEAEIECAEDAVWLFDRVTGTTLIDYRTAKAGEAGKDEGRAIKQGERFRIVGAIYFSKGKNGWKTDSVAMRRFPREVR